MKAWFSHFGFKKPAKKWFECVYLVIRWFFFYQFYPILDDFWSFIVCCSILNCQKFGKINLLNFLLKPLLKKYAASQNRETEFNKTLIHHYRLLTSFIGRGCNYFFFVLQEWLAFFCESPCLIQTFSHMYVFQFSNWEKTVCLIVLD